MKPFSLLGTAALLSTLSACNGVSVGPHAKTRIDEDTPESHLAGVQANPDFNSLIQTPVCDQGNLTVRAVTYEADYTVSYTDAMGATQTCEAHTEFFVDTRSSLVKGVEQCSDAGYFRQFSTSQYTLSGGSLVIEGLGSLNVGAGNPYYLSPSVATSDENVGVVRLDEHQLGATGDTGYYSFLCQ